MKRKGVIITILLILIVVAVVLTIVFINLFKEKDTKDLAKSVNEVTQSGYLSEANEQNQKIDEYLQSLLKISALEQQHEAIENYAFAYSAFEVVGQFFNRQIVFTQYTDVYKANRNAIKSNFEKAENSAYSLAAYLNEMESNIAGSEDWLALSWDVCKSQVEEMFVSTRSALVGLMEVYEASVSSKMANNNFSTLIFDEFKEMTEANVTVETKFNGQELSTFVNAYLSEEGEKYIYAYVFDTNLQGKVKDIQEFGKNSVYFPTFYAGQLTVEGV